MVMLLISAFELMRSVRVVPEPRPMFRTVSTARAFSARSLPKFATLISKFVTCQAARASSCAAPLETQNTIRSSERRNLQFPIFIFNFSIRGAHQRMNVSQAFEQRAHSFQRQHVWAV